MTIITSGTITGQSIDILSGSMDGTLETSAQPNITSVGTLSNLNVTGELNGTLSTPTQSNITSVGTLSNLKVTGKINGIQNVFTENVGGSLQGSITTFISGNPDSSTIIGGKIITQDDGNTTQKEFKLSCGEGSRERSIVIQENQPVLINTDLAVYSELSCAELQVDNLIKLGVDSGNAGEVLTSNGSNNPTWSAIPPITAIDNIIIGANTPAAGSFTNLTVNGTISTMYIKSPENQTASNPQAPGQLRLESGNTVNGGNSEIRINPYGISYQANYQNFFNGTGANSCQVRINGVLRYSSDDRLKHNEVDVSNALVIVRQLVAKKYEKTAEPKDANFNGELTEDYIVETGFIAQEVMKIPDLSYCVSSGKTGLGKDIYYLNYSDIFVVNVEAVKELDAIVTTQAMAIKDLNVVVSDLKERLIKLENKLK